MSTTLNSHNVRMLICLLGPLLVPIAICSSYVIFTSPQSGERDGTYDVTIFIVAVGIGAASVLLVPWSWPYRVMAVIVYLPLITYIIVIYWIFFECGWRGGALP